MQIAQDVGPRPRPSESSFGASSFSAFPAFSFSPQFFFTRRNASVAGITTLQHPVAIDGRAAFPGRHRRASSEFQEGAMKHVLEQGNEFDRVGFAGSLNSPGWYGRAAVVGLSCYYS